MRHGEAPTGNESFDFVEPTVRTELGWDRFLTAIDEGRFPTNLELGLEHPVSIPTIHAAAWATVWERLTAIADDGLSMGLPFGRWETPEEATHPHAIGQPTVQTSSIEMADRWLIDQGAFLLEYPWWMLGSQPPAEFWVNAVLESPIFHWYERSARAAGQQAASRLSGRFEFDRRMGLEEVAACLDAALPLPPVEGQLSSLHVAVVALVDRACGPVRLRTPGDIYPKPPGRWSWRERQAPSTETFAFHVHVYGLTSSRPYEGHLELIESTPLSGQAADSINGISDS